MKIEVFVIGLMIGAFITIMLIPHGIKFVDWIVQQQLWIIATTISLFGGIGGYSAIKLYNKMWE